MNELIRTLSIIGAAVLLALAAFLVGRDSPEITAASEVGKHFVAIDDSSAVKGLKIVKFDDTTNRTEEFEVAQIDGLWRIPSHQNYPADAEQHLVDAATSVMNVEILDAVSDDKGSHEEYGVLDPTQLGETAGATGVGDRVSLLDAQRKPIAEFIIGRQVQDQMGQRYARRVGLDQVYVVKIDPSRLSTRFADWIEEDLLQLDPFDISRITFDNYSVRRAVDARGNPVALKLPESEIVVSYDSLENEWRLDSLREAVEPGRPESALEAVELGEDEQLNTEHLDALRSALDDLEIVDVERKPAGLKGNSLEEFLTKNRAAFTSLFNRGFSVRYNESKQEIEVVSDEGDVRVGMNDGVEYVLRFGNVAGGEQRQSQQPQADGESDTQDAATAKSDVLRYLWVTAEYNEELIEKPELLPLPEERPAGEQPPVVDPDASDDSADATESEPTVGESPKEEIDESGSAEEPAPSETPSEETPSEETTAEETTAEETPAEQPADEEASDESPTGPQGAEGEASPAGAPGDSTPGEPAAQDPVSEVPIDEDGASPESEPAGEQPADDAGQPVDATADEETADEASSTEQPGGASVEDGDDDEPLLEDLGPPRAEVIAENERLQRQYEEKRQAAQAQVDALNEKFADWYFVISNDVYEQIHLSQDQIIEPKPAEDEDEQPASDPAVPGSLEEFNDLRQLPN